MERDGVSQAHPEQVISICKLDEQQWFNYSNILCQTFPFSASFEHTYLAFFFKKKSLLKLLF